jgi:serine/threonine protein kinase
VRAGQVGSDVGLRKQLMTGRQIEELCDALSEAFDQDSLDRMLRFRLDKDREHLVGFGDLQTVIFKLISLAVREGWQANLLRAALASNPGNPALRRFCKENADLALCEEDSVPPSITPSDESGQTVGKYELVRLVARTGSGTTWFARDTALDHDVILKSYSLVGSSPDQHGRVVAEVQQRSRVRHPALITPIDVVLVDGTLFVATSFQPGVQSLREFLWEEGRRQGAIAPETACQLMSQVTLGLSHAHAMGVSHQCLDSWDILIDPDARVWVAGFERAVIYDSYKECGKALQIGTLRYFSPEMVRGEQLDAGTDVYHIGIILFELVTGMSPFHAGISRDVSLSLECIRFEPIIDGKLRAICMKCLQIRKEDRFANAAQLFEALRSTSVSKRWWQFWK